MLRRYRWFRLLLLKISNHILEDRILDFLYPDNCTITFADARENPYHCLTVCEYMGCSQYLDVKCDMRDHDGTCMKYTGWVYPLPKIEELDVNGKYPKIGGS